MGRAPRMARSGLPLIATSAMASRANRAENQALEPGRRAAWLLKGRGWVARPPGRRGVSCHRSVCGPSPRSQAFARLEPSPRRDGPSGRFAKSARQTIVQVLAAELRSDGIVSPAPSMTGAGRAESQSSWLRGSCAAKGEQDRCEPARAGQIVRAPSGLIGPPPRPDPRQRGSPRTTGRRPLDRAARRARINPCCTGRRSPW
jgi:hypothetical protein